MEAILSTRKDSTLEQLIEAIVSYASFLVPLLAIWAIAGLYTQQPGCQCIATQVLYLSVLLFIAGITIRTVTNDGEGLLIHTASLGTLVVFGVMRRPDERATEAIPGDSFSESLSA